MRKNGFTFIEVVFAVSIFLIATLGIYESYRVLFASISFSNNKILVASLINERFEVARNLPYTSVGVVGGNPNGVISGSQTLIRDGVSWTVNTIIQNVDDPFDGLAPTDTKPADYKRMELTVSCQTCKNLIPVTVTGLIAPRNLEP